MTTVEKFTAVATPVETGYVIAVRRDPHPEGHVPVAFPRLEVTEWSAEVASSLLLDVYGYATAPGSSWQKLGKTASYGIRLVGEAA